MTAAFSTEAGAAPDAGKLAAIPSALQESVDAGELSGAVTLVAQEGRILGFEAVGCADLKARLPMQKDTLFWVASMTKPVTSAAILLLADEAKLALSDQVEKYLPEFRSMWMVAEATGDRKVLTRPSRGVTIRDLLTHTHGLEEPPMPAPDTPLAEAATAAARGPLHFEPGSQWKYGNASMTVLGRIVEVVSGTAYPEFLRERFFEPLGMRDTTFFPDSAQLDRLAKTYNRLVEGGPLEEMPIAILNGNLREKTQTVAPGAGLFSTAEDMFRFYQMLANGGEFEGRRYLAAATVREMRTSQTGEFEAGFSSGMGWGLGVGVVRRPEGWTEMLPAGTWGHDGAYGTTVMIEPEQHLVFIMMIQRGGLNPFADGLRFRAAFHTVVMKAFRD
jgi:CubicO group peptidase (beta-lactamase class C family)